MAWIKRNLFFVLSMAAGLILTGYCAWLFTGDLSGSSALIKEFQDDVVQYNELQQKSPYPSEENIKAAKEDQRRVKELEDELRKSFTPFPTPPKEDEKGFSAYVEDTILDLRTKATNAEVGLPDNFAFGFTDQRGKLNYPAGHIQPWMQQLTEIKALCDILYRAKINSLVSFRRVAVSSNEMVQSPNDSFGARTVSTPMQTVTPYKIDFRGFTRELAAVMEGLARSGNCYIVKNIVVRPAGARVLDQPALAPASAPGAAAPPPTVALPPVPQMTPGMDRNSFARVMEVYRNRVAAIERAAAANAAAASRTVAAPLSGGPVTVEREQLLYITISVDVVKFK